ncbi:MAG TPA: MGMT family protein, partial [Dehalococcoidia bacterium]|nr:MGMT family protein [Dehalococcoidia bacterium]
MSIPQALPPDRIGGMELRYRVELGRATEFQRRVLGVVAQIPYGETRSYSWVAQRAGGSPRAVG